MPSFSKPFAPPLPSIVGTAVPSRLPLSFLGSPLPQLLRGYQSLNPTPTWFQVPTQHLGGSAETSAFLGHVELRAIVRTTSFISCFSQVLNHQMHWGLVSKQIPRDPGDSESASLGWGQEQAWLTGTLRWSGEPWFGNASLCCVRSLVHWGWQDIPPLWSIFWVTLLVLSCKDKHWMRRGPSFRYLCGWLAM